MKKFTSISLLLAILAIIVVLIAFYGNPIELLKPKTTEKEQPVIQPSSPTPAVTEVPIEQPQIAYKTYKEKEVDNQGYFEKVVKVKSEYVYIASPIKVEVDNPPTLIIYSHGSNTTIKPDFNDSFMKDMQYYGKYFAKKGFVFTASSMHGMNYGSSQSVQDMKNLESWVSQNYLVKTNVNLIGFSMGGLPTLNYLFLYPKTIHKVALLAPVSGDYTQSQFQSIKNIPIQIWHGNKDVNVPLSLSTHLQSVYNSYGYKNLKLTIVEGKGHFDIDTEKITDIYKFFINE